MGTNRSVIVAALASPLGLGQKIAVYNRKLKWVVPLDFVLLVILLPV